MENYLIKQNKSIKHSFAVASVVASLSFLLASPAFSASACKGLTLEKCGLATACSWVGGYERSDGKKVRAFCRTKYKAKKSANKKVANKKVVSAKASVEKQKTSKIKK